MWSLVRRIRFGLAVLVSMGAGLVVQAQELPENCVREGCHTELAVAPVVHEPILKGECTGCHPVREAGRPAMRASKAHAGFVVDTQRSAVSCQPCHQDVRKVHGVEQAAESASCLRCHAPHGGVAAHLMRGPEVDLCRGCHDETVASLPRLDSEKPQEQMPPEQISQQIPQEEDATQKAVYLHGPFKEGRCSPCHLAHELDPKKLLRGSYPQHSYTTYAREKYTACLGVCHDPALVEDPKTEQATRFRNGDDNLHYRHVARRKRGRSCQLCHLSHAGSVEFLMRSDMSFGNERLTLTFSSTESGGTCQTTCHTELKYDRDDWVPSPMRVEDP